jgi:signal transduction histidine kinase
VAYRRTKPVFLWIAAIPILLLGAALWSRTEYRGLVRLLDHTRQVQLAIQDLLVSLTDAETSRRGFLATADPSYIGAVDAAAAKAPALLARLSNLTQDNPAQRANLRELERLVNDRVALLQETSRPGHEPAVQAEKRSGLAISAQLNNVIASLMAEETRIFEQRKQATAAADFAAETFLVTGCIATIILLIIAYRIMGRYAGDRDRAEAEVWRSNQELHEKIQQLDQLNRELENRVKERTASLERSNRDLQQFAFIASHDLQEPLRMVASYMGLLSKSLRGKLAPEEEHHMQFALDGAARMQTLIRDLLAYAQAGSQVPELKSTRLNEVVKQARYAVLESIRETGAEISVGELPAVHADPLKMSLVFQNLISNAIKFRQPGAKPSIRIEAQREADVWRVAVRDDGIGFDPKYSEKIFVVFQRLHGKNEYPGTGIGLAICKRIIEGHGGRIWADARPGGGATFYFTLPAAAESSSSPAPEDLPEMPPVPFRQVRGAGPAA